ncbi:MAG TPA: hypothetical protein VGM15_03135 [Burkholderiaceae bacterium]
MITITIEIQEVPGCGVLVGVTAKATRDFVTDSERAMHDVVVEAYEIALAKAGQAVLLIDEQKKT